MENDKIKEQLNQMMEMFKNAQIERSAFIFLPSPDGFKIYKANEDICTLALMAQEQSTREEYNNVVINCRTCKYQKVSLNENPCYDCRDNDKYEIK